MPFSIKVLFVILIFGSMARAQNAAPSNKNAFNPDLSVNGLFLYRNSNRGNDFNSEEPNGFGLDEAEVQFFSDVDPYLRANVMLSVHRDEATKKWAIEPEEAYVESLSLPIATVKIGKFKTAFGKYNPVHTHALPFIDNQLIANTLLGESLNGEGLSAAILIPANWFSELALQTVAKTDAPFNGTSPNQSTQIAHLKNLWDLTDDLTMEWGLSGAEGTDILNKQNSLWASDFTLKWRPTNGGKYRAWIWSSEVMGGSRSLLFDGKTSGAYTFLQWQMAERWWVQGRTEYTEQTLAATSEHLVQRKNTLLAAYVPTEFSAWRIQLDRLVDGRVDPENRILLQLNFTIGAHPAHSY